jgi:transposase InsO family protein
VLCAAAHNTYAWTGSSFCYTNFITDAFARRIIGWRVSRSLRTDLALDALEMAVQQRRAPNPKMPASHDLKYRIVDEFRPEAGPRKGPPTESRRFALDCDDSFRASP